TTFATVGLDSSGRASLVSATLPPGVHNVTATYNPSGTFLSSSAALNQTITQPTALALTSSPNPSDSGAAVTFTATVSVTSGTGTPTGRVTFQEGSTVLATVNLDSNGTASFVTANLGAGSHAITAGYNPSGIFLGSSNSLSQSVNAPAPGKQATSTGLVS